jgi:hypothetical protein
MPWRRLTLESAEKNVDTLAWRFMGTAALRCWATVSNSSARPGNSRETALPRKGAHPAWLSAKPRRAADGRNSRDSCFWVNFLPQLAAKGPDEWRDPNHVGSHVW